MAVKINKDAAKQTLKEGASRLLRAAIYYEDHLKAKLGVSNHSHLWTTRGKGFI